MAWDASTILLIVLLAGLGGFLVWAAREIVQEMRQGISTVTEVLLTGCLYPVACVGFLVLVVFLWEMTQRNLAEFRNRPVWAGGPLVPALVSGWWLAVFVVDTLSGLYGLVGSFAMFGAHGIQKWRHRLPVIGPFVDAYWRLTELAGSLERRDRITIWVHHVAFSIGLLIVGAAGLSNVFGLWKQAPIPGIALLLLLPLNPAFADRGRLDTALFEINLRDQADGAVRRADDSAIVPHPGGSEGSDEW